MNLNRVIQVALQAKRMGDTGPLSTGEALTAALVLNRHDWLQEMDYTIAQALDRIDADTIQHLGDAARCVIGNEDDSFGPVAHVYDAMGQWPGTKEGGYRHG
jgi:hypothetical protein